MSTLNIRRGGSNEYPQSILCAEIRKNNVYPCKPQFYYIKVGLTGAKLYRHVFVMYIIAVNISSRFPHEELSHPCLSKMRLVKILIRLRECAG